MKRLAAAATGALLTFLGLVGTVLPLITAFSLPVCLWALFGAGALLTVYFTTLFSIKSRLRYLMLLLFAAAWAFVCFGSLSEVRAGAQIAIAGVANELALALPSVSVLALPAGVAAPQYAPLCTLFFAVLTAPVLLLYSWSIGSLSSAAPCLMVSLPFFAVTMVLVDRPPSLFSVLCVLSFWGLLALTSGVRRASEKRGAVLFCLYLPIAALLCALVLLASPREGYVRPMWPDVLRRQLAEHLSTAEAGASAKPTLIETAGRVAVSRPEAAVNVSGLGPRRTFGTALLELTAAQDGKLYLRGMALGRYDGAAWHAVTDEPPSGAGAIAQVTADVLAAQPAQTVRLRHLSGESALAYMPYFAVSGDGALGESYARPPDASGSYSWSYVPAEAPETLPLPSRADERAYRAWAQAQYTALPEPLAETLRSLAASAGIDANAPRTELVRAVAAYVADAAVYDTESARTPAGSDFVLHFLTVSRRGYCVHYASAATAMLQALGVPARYVSGFLAEAHADAAAAVTDDDAHAWTEYYLDGFGWVPVEVTGSRSDAPLPEPTASAAPSAAAPTASPTLDPTAPPSAAPEAAAPAHTPAPTVSAASSAVGPTEAPAIGSAQAVPTAAEMPAETPRRSGTLLLLLLPGAIAIALVLRYRMRAARREAQLTGGTNRARILAAWRELQRLGRYGVCPPEALRTIAEEARFSDHAMTDTAREQMLGRLQAERQRLSETLPTLRRLIARYLRMDL